MIIFFRYIYEQLRNEKIKSMALILEVENLLNFLIFIYFDFEYFSTLILHTFPVLSQCLKM